MRAIAFLFLLLYAGFLPAQKVRDSVKIYPRQEKTDLVSSLNNNQSALERIVNNLQTGYSDSTLNMGIEVSPINTASVQDTTYIKGKPGSQSFYMDIRTNMLYDALLIPNIGVEFHLGKNWSVVANWVYAWWKIDRRHWYWRIYGGDIAIRKWFGKTAKNKPLTGHHLGIYGQIFTYDFEKGGRGYMGGKPDGTLWNKMNYAAGVEYGYSLPIAGRLNVDFTIGIGYWGGTYHEYKLVDDCYVWQVTKQRRWLGPTKAEVSLVWLIGSNNYNCRKGGKR